MAGFTTVQSVGAPNDIPLRDAIEKGTIPGPRILTAVEPLPGQGEINGTPDEIRSFVRKQKAGEDPSDGTRTHPTRDENSRTESCVWHRCSGGAHGRNAEECIDRVRDCGVDPMAAMVSANSLGAEALRMGDQIGSIAPRFQADIIALDGNPLRDITAVRRVVFVMKGGVIYKNVRRVIPIYAGTEP